MKNQSWKITSLVLLLAQIVLFKNLTNNPDWIEFNYINHFFRHLSRLLRIITSPFNFSIGLILVYLASIGLIWWLFKSIYLFPKKKIHFKQFLLNILAFLSPVYLFYMLTWGLAYHKKPINELMNLNKENITDSEIIALTESLIEEINVSRKIVNQDSLEKITLEKIFKQAPKGYHQLSAIFPYLSYQNSSLKKAAGSTFLAYMSTSGIYMFPTGEANINTFNVLYEAPFVCSHEMAHQLGFASEDEANFLAYLACRNHPNPIFRYSANYGIVFRTLNKVWEIDSTLSKRLFKKLDPLVIKDLEKEKTVWKKFRNPFQKYIFAPFYDLFLKSNGIKEGSRSYDLVVELLVAEKRKKQKLSNR